MREVYQMVRTFEGSRQRIRWPDFQEELERRFPAVDDEYLALVKELWDSGELFENTAVAGDVVNGRQTYY